MKKYLKAIALMIAALMLAGSLVSCAEIVSGDTDFINDYINELYGSLGLIETQPNDDVGSDESGGIKVPADGESENNSNESESADDGENESEKAPAESESEDTRVYNVLCGVPSNTPTKTLTCGDGSFARKYTNFQAWQISSIRNKYKENGYTEYCYRDTDNTISATFVGGDTYATMFYRKGDRDMVLVTSEKDGKLLPFGTKDYTRVCETTFTQPGLVSAGGMCEIIRLADGSFLIFDSGNPIEADVIYETLVELNGSKENIRISAWVFTHSHGDHYGGFKGNGNEYAGFASKYSKNVELDYVFYAPLARNEWDVMNSYNVSWNTIDYYFNGGFQWRVGDAFPDATLVPVHAGQTFKIVDVTLEILYSPECVYIDSIPVNSNNTSLFCRVVGDDGGAAIITADCETEGGLWVDHTYTTELQANIMQMTHHGMIAEADLSIMKKSGATTFFWPSGEDKYNDTSRSNLTAKQYAARFGENILHGYGTMTRPLDYEGTPASGPELLKNSFQTYTAYNTNIDTTKYNALIITVSGMGQTAEGYIYFTTNSQPDFTDANKKKLGAQGSPYSGYSDRKLIVYFGNCTDYIGNVTSIKIDLNANITSIQPYKI